MSLTGKLVDRNGKLYVLYQSAHDSEPKITYMWWLVDKTVGNPYHCDRPEPGDIATYQSDGRTWQTRRPDTHASSGSVICQGDGNTKAEFVETVSAPDPKVRANIETRWYHGRWEKYSKVKGWIAA